MCNGAYAWFVHGLASRSADRLRAGFVHLLGPFRSVDVAWAAAAEVIESADGNALLEVIGEFVLPPPEGPASRPFQTLHVDFGVPLIPSQSADVARFTALHVAANACLTQASTRLVAVAPLLAQRRWPDHDQLIDRFEAYGHTHGAWDDTAGYTEGSLARIIEAAVGDPPVLASVKTTPGFRCGLEFTGMAEELAFFAHRGVALGGVEQEVRLRPGELLIFDNQLVAHGRRGSRQPGELHQRVIGHRRAPPDRQRAIRDRFLTAFA
jgi:hypothetical protein